MNPLNAHTFPLNGQTLIEASAGTGKTYTIASLYSRLLLGHHHQLGADLTSRDHAPLRCDQILVVTFTKAATEELRGRIRARLRDNFEDVLRLEQGRAPTDAMLASMIDDIRSEQGDAFDATWWVQWLQTNVANMDDAAIFTIHGFCQRMLKQYALDSGLLFDAELLLDTHEYVQQACRDVWRHITYPMSQTRLLSFMSLYSGPDAFAEALNNYVQHTDSTLLPYVSAADSPIEQAWDALETTFLNAKQHWQSATEAELFDLIQSSGVDKRSYRKNLLPKWISEVSAYFEIGACLDVPKNLERFSQATLREKTTKDGAPEHDAFSAIDALMDRVTDMQARVRMYTLKRLTEHYWDVLSDARVLSPNDLIRLLHQALHSDQGDALATRIRAQYPAAMIDEFQDTDHLQYDIFNRIYPPSTDPKTPYSLTMIGDPKQAIYGFRGADIFTYIHASKQLDDAQRFTLDTNWRSTQALVAAVNRLWQQHPKPFVYDNDIQFYPVKAQPLTTQPVNEPSGDAKHGLWMDGQVTPAMQFWLSRADDAHEMPNASTLEQARHRVATQCAQHIRRLLSAPATLNGGDVQAKDIAVLVRTRAQAQRVQTALRAHGVGSVFLTRSSVYQSQQAIDLWRWLNAITNLHDETQVRSACATHSHGLSGEQLSALSGDEHAWETQLEAMSRYRDACQKRGVMAALSLWLQDDDRAVALRQGEQGERCLTNMLHLGELLQQASRRLQGLPALLRWFGERVFDQKHHDDEAQLRLETEENLVSIITIHQSKGLAYPIVMLPYLWDDTPRKQDREAHYHDERLGKVIHLMPDDAAKAKAERDQLAESTRLLYVALTRAEYCNVVWLDDVPAKVGKPRPRMLHSALGYVMKPVFDAHALKGADTGADTSAGEQTSANGQDNDHLPALSVLNDESWSFNEMPDWPEGKVAPPPSQTTLHAKRLTRRVHSHWKVSSYSQLLHSSQHKQEAELATTFLKHDEPEHPQATDEAVMDGLLHAGAQWFPKGAEAGVCLHSIFEHWDFNDPQALDDLTRQYLNRHGFGLPDEPTLSAVCQWLVEVANTPVFAPSSDAQDGRDVRLCDVQRHERVDEMAFVLPIAQLTPQRLQPLLDGEARLHFDPLSGYLKGFMDLVCCIDGRYFVLDYKSNALERYDQDGLNQAMCDHHYDLQAGIYVLALDRLLTARLVDYDPKRHLGGAVYAFVRGMSPEGNTGVWYQPADEAYLERWRATLLRDGSYASHRASISSRASEPYTQGELDL